MGLVRHWNKLNTFTPLRGYIGEMISELMEIGLKNGEARVYNSLLKLGSSKVGSIVMDSRVSYSKVFDVLERLILKGLVSFIRIGDIRHINAVEPYILQDFPEKRGTWKNLMLEYQASTKKFCSCYMNMKQPKKIWKNINQADPFYLK